MNLLKFHDSNGSNEVPMVEVHMDDDAIEFVHRQKQKEVTMDDQIVENIVVDSVVVKENNVNIGLLKATTSS